MGMRNVKKIMVLLLAASMILPAVSVQAEEAEQVLSEEQRAVSSVESVYDLIECLYKVTSTETGKSITYDGGLKVNAQTADTEEQWVSVIRYGDFNTADPLDNIPVAFRTGSDGKYFALGQNADVDAKVMVEEQISSDRTEQFILKKSSDWSKENLAYKIYHPLSRMYVGYSAEEPHTLQVCGKEAPAYDFVFTKAGDSVLGQVRNVEGYVLLTEHEKERVFDLFGGIGAYSICYYGGADVSQSFAQRSMVELQELYDNLENMTTEQQAEKIRAIMQKPAFSGQTNWYGLPALPGAEEVKLEIQDETYGTYDFWRGSLSNGTKYTLVVTDTNASQIINFYVEDNGVAISNGNNAMEALKQIPYPLRKNIKNMYIRNDSASSYNCGQNDFYMRINRVANKDEIAMYMTHEFGHSMDFSYNVNGGNIWQPARDSDIAGVSVYGNNNGNEDLADFGRLYFQCYGDINKMYGIRQIFPERYNAYVNVLRQTGYSDILAEKTESIEQGSYKTKLKGLVEKAEAKAAKKDMYTEESMAALLEAVAQAKSVIDNMEVTQATVDEAYENVYNALGRLELAEKKKIASFSFDDVANGFTSDNAVAHNMGTPQLSDDARAGKALSLDGSAANYLKITKRDGTPLLSGYDELTISFWSKVNTDSNWALYAAPNDNENQYQWENYLGILDSKTKVTVERYKNTGIRSNSTVANTAANEWKFITVVVRENNTSVYVNGVREAVEDSKVLLSDILGDESVLYIGKANWGDNGEYFKGLLDEFAIYNYPMTNVQVAALYEGTEPDESQVVTKTDQRKAEEVSALIKKIGPVTYSPNVKAKIDVAREAYDSLNDIQKELVEPEILEILENAEQSYAEAKEKFEALGKCRIAYFTFDDEEKGFESEYAKAANKGKPILTEDAKQGKALSLDGKNSNYLKVTDKDGKPLLTGYDEITICYWGKVEAITGGNWSFFAAPNNRTAEYNHEEYMAALDNGNSLTVERYKNSGSRPEVNTAEVIADAWRFVTIVVSRDKTVLYVDAEKVSEVASEHLLSDILQDNSVCYIGRANWNAGEYFKGLIDEYSIYNYALTAGQVNDVYQNHEIEEFTILSLAGEGGTITPDGTVTVKAGENQSFSIKADSGYEIEDVLVNGKSVGVVESYVFEEVSENHTIEAVFKQKTEEKILIDTITLSESEAEIEIGTTLKLEATIWPKEAANQTLTWNSSAPDIADVDMNGLITAYKAGVAEITASAQDGGGATAKCVITVLGNSEKPVEEERPQYVSTVPRGTVFSDSSAKAVYKVTKSGTVSNNSVTGAEVAYVKQTANAASVKIPDKVVSDGVEYKVTSIEDNAFKNNKRLTKMKIGNNVCVIGSGAFSGCKKLKSITIGKNVIEIKTKAFYKCSALTKITIPSKVGKIGKQAFYGCKKLKSIVIKTSKLTTKKVGSNAFKGIYKKATVKVPKKKLKAYKKLLKKKGIPSKTKIKK